MAANPGTVHAHIAGVKVDPGFAPGRDGPGRTGGDTGFAAAAQAGIDLHRPAQAQPASQGMGQALQGTGGAQELIFYMIYVL